MSKKVMTLSASPRKVLNSQWYSRRWRICTRCVILMLHSVVQKGALRPIAAEQYEKNPFYSVCGYAYGFSGGLRQGPVEAFI